MKKALPGNIIAWVDVDSILVNFYAYFHSFLEDRYAIRIPHDFVPDSWTYEGLLGERKFSEVFDSLPGDWTLRVKAYAGAASFTHKLHQMGCHVVLVTHVPETQKINRMKSLIEQGIYFDEIYFPFGSPKSTVAKALTPRYKSKDGSEIIGLFVDDYMVNVIDMAGLSEIHKCFSLAYPFNLKLLSKDPLITSKIDFSSQNPEELYQAVLKYVSVTTIL